MKKKVNKPSYITDWIISDKYGEGEYFNAALYSWIDGLLDLPEERHDKMPATWWKTTFADAYFMKVENLFKDNIPKYDDEIQMIQLIRTMIKKKDFHLLFLITLRIATAAFQSGLIPEKISKSEASEMGASKGGQKKKVIDDKRHKQWKIDAEEIKKKYPSYTPWRIAGMLKDRYNGNNKLLSKQDTIYRIIK